MPKTAKGRKILAAMSRQYGSKKAEQVFYASRNKGTITSVDGDSNMTTSMDALASTWDKLVRRATYDKSWSGARRRTSRDAAGMPYTPAPSGSPSRLSPEASPATPSAAPTAATPSAAPTAATPSAAPKAATLGPPGSGYKDAWPKSTGPRSITASTGKTYTAQPKTPLSAMRTGSPAWRQEVTSQNAATRRTQMAGTAGIKSSKDSHVSVWRRAKARVSDATPYPFGVKPDTSSQNSTPSTSAGSGTTPYPFGVKPDTTSPPPAKDAKPTIRRMPKKPTGRTHFGGKIISGDAALPPTLNPLMGANTATTPTPKAPEGYSNTPYGVMPTSNWNDYKAATKDRKVFFKGSVRDALKRGASTHDAISHALDAVYGKVKLPPHPKARRARIRMRKL